MKAMQTEASPLVNKFKLAEEPNSVYASLSSDFAMLIYGLHNLPYYILLHEL